MKIKLRTLIFIVAIIAVLLTLFSSITASNKVSEKTLINNTLETNRVYSQKIASSTDDFLNTTLQTLEYSANDIAGYLQKDNPEDLLLNEAERLLHQTTTFNSVVITSADGEIVAASPESLKVIGKQLESPVEQKALAEEKTSITRPYISITGRLIIYISQPIFDNDGTYYGMVGGSIYLLDDNILYDLLGEHYYQDGSYVYVMDEKGRILYHPEIDRINDIIVNNPVKEEIVQGNSGSMRLTNSKGIDMLAGYGYIPTAKWSIVSQRPVDVALAPSKMIRNEIILKIIPYAIIILIVIIITSQIIAYPLHKLAEYGRKIIDDEEDVKLGNIRSWYYEAHQLEEKLFTTFLYYKDEIDHFSRQSKTDHLTNLLNRRMMETIMDNWMVNEFPFSVLMIDIDSFKYVNDTYGHDVGDEVLIFLAKKMAGIARKHDVPCRYGGEEFIILLPDTTKEQAYQVAERLRMRLEETVSPSGEIVTISSGISHYPKEGMSITELIKIADERMYRAKGEGRNRTIVDDE